MIYLLGTVTKFDVFLKFDSLHATTYIWILAMSLNIDITNCRVCMKTTDGIPIYLDSETGKKFQFCTQLEISKTDYLPKIICNKCVGRLEIAYDFRKQAECSDKYLRQILTRNMEELNQSAQMKQSLGDEMFLEINKTRIKMEQFDQIEQLTNVKPQQISRVNMPPAQNGIATAEIIEESIHYKGIERDADRIPGYAVFQEYSASACESDVIKTEEIEEDKIQETKPINLFTVTKVISNNGGNHKGKHECIVCGAFFTRNASLKRHSLIHSGERPHKCKFCGRGFIQSNNLTLHMNKHKRGKPYICKICGLHFRYNTSLKRHVLIKHENQMKVEVKIKVINQRGRKKSPTRNTTATLETIEEGVHYKETEISDIVKTEEIKEEKVQQTKPINLFTITEVTSIRSDEGDQTDKHECLVCGAVFTRNASLKRHSLIHTGERPYKCKFCGRGFNQSSNLTCHMRQHKRGKPYICETCGLHFRYKTCLKRHVIIKHENRKKAEVKIKVLKQRGRKRPPSRNTTALLETREDVYYKETERQVLISDIVNDESDIVKTEEIEEEKVQQTKPINLFTIAEVTSIHSDEGDQTDKYECIICGTLFTRKGSLKRHSRIHSGERPYTCTLCGRSFNQSYSVASHMRLHTGETPYNCKTCGLHFRFRTSLTRHILKHEKQKKAKVEIYVSDD